MVKKKSLEQHMDEAFPLKRQTRRQVGGQQQGVKKILPAVEIRIRIRKNSKLLAGVTIGGGDEMGGSIPIFETVL